MEDVAALVERFPDPDLRRRASPSIESANDGLEWVRAQEHAWTTGERFAFAVLEAGGDASPPRVVGGVVLKDVASYRPCAEVGYWTAAQARGHGVAPRALEALTTWAFDTFRTEGLDYLDLIHQIDNPASCRVAEKCGFTLTGTLPPAPPAYPLEGHRHRLHADA